MAPFVALIVSFAVLAALRWAIGARRLSWSLAGRIALSLMLLFTGAGHFAMTIPLAGMLPAFFPGRVPIVLITGVLELLAAVGLLVPATSRVTGWCLVAFFIGVLPANVYAAFRGTGIGDHGPAYLLFRIPFQLLLIWWAWFFTRPAWSSDLEDPGT